MREHPEDTMVVDAHKALNRLNKSTRQGWGDWGVVGRCLAHGSTLAMREANTNEPKGQAYIRHFSKWLHDNRLSERPDPGTRAALLKLMPDYDEITAWLNTLTDHERGLTNHPRVVLKKFLGRDATPKPRRREAADRLIQATIERPDGPPPAGIEAELARAKEVIEEFAIVRDPTDSGGRIVRQLLTLKLPPVQRKKWLESVIRVLTRAKNDGGRMMALATGLSLGPQIMVTSGHCWVSSLCWFRHHAAELLMFCG